ncbi:HlyD family efflux transporter periplasmic adaptor subunit, partial [Pseudomonadota bacterium]|nr:HlyD family efflux transporter periplasmic adaptor subunit [Pseudomonadota bacterium]
HVLRDKTELKSVQQQLDISRSMHDDAESLYNNGGLISAEEYQKKRSQYLLQQAKFEQLQKNEEREALEYRLSLAQVSKRVLKATFSGVVTRLLFDVGESVEANQILVKLVDSRQGIFVSNIDARARGLLQENQEVILKIEDGPQFLERKGKVIFISPVVDAASNLVRCKVLFDNVDGKVRLGVSAKMLLKAVD